MESTPKQRQDIGYFRKLLGLSDELYKDMLYMSYNVESSKQLTYNRAKEFLNYLRNKAKEAGVFQPKKQYVFQKYKHNNLDKRGDMATPKQLRKIEALWFEVSYQTTDQAREEALTKIIKRVAGVDNLKFLPRDKVSKVIKMLEQMLEQMKKQKENN